MALLFCDGCDRYTDTTSLSTLGWISDDTTNITLDTTGSNWGGKAIKIGDVGAQNISTFPGIAKRFNRRPTGTTIRLAFWIRTNTSQTFGSATSLTGGETLFSLNEGTFGVFTDAHNICGMVHSDGCIHVYGFDDWSGNGRGGGGDGTIPINDGNAHHFELEFTLNNLSSGVVKTWVDGVADINLTGADTDNSAGDHNLTYLNSIKFGGGKVNPGASDFIVIDDIIVWDDDTSDSENTMSGQLPNHTHRIETKTVSTDGDTSQFTRSTGSSNAANVDDLHNGDTDYNNSTTDANKDLYGMSSSSVYADSVIAVNVCHVARKTSSSNGIPKIRAIAKNNGTTRTATQRPVPSTSYSIIEFPMCKDPDGAAAWTHDELQSTTFGMERKTN